MRAWILFSIKTLFMILYATFGQVYWVNRDSSNDELELDGDELPEQGLINQELKETFGGVPETIVILMITVSTMLCLACWFWPKIALSFIYIESLWVIFDTVFILQSVSHQSSLVITVRCIGAGILLGVDFQLTISTVTSCGILA